MGQCLDNVSLRPVLKSAKDGLPMRAELAVIAAWLDTHTKPA